MLPLIEGCPGHILPRAVRVPALLSFAASDGVLSTLIWLGFTLRRLPSQSLLDMPALMAGLSAGHIFAEGSPESLALISALAAGDPAAAAAAAAAAVAAHASAGEASRKRAAPGGLGGSGAKRARTWGASVPQPETYSVGSSPYKIQWFTPASQPERRWRNRRARPLPDGGSGIRRATARPAAGGRVWPGAGARARHRPCRPSPATAHRAGAHSGLGWVGLAQELSHDTYHVGLALSQRIAQVRI